METARSAAWESASNQATISFTSPSGRSRGFCKFFFTPIKERIWLSKRPAFEITDWGIQLNNRRPKGLNPSSCPIHAHDLSDIFYYVWVLPVIKSWQTNRCPGLRSLKRRGCTDEVEDEMKIWRGQIKSTFRNWGSINYEALPLS